MKRLLLWTIGTLFTLSLGQQPGAPKISLGIADARYRQLPYGVTNASAGLALWRASLYRTGYTTAGVGLGGVSIMAIGDSWQMGVGGDGHPNEFYDCYPNRLRVKLQSRFGGGTGLGYQPAVYPNTSTGGTQFSFDANGWTKQSQTSGIGSAFSNTAGAQCRWYLAAPSSPTTVTNNLQGAGVTGVEAVYVSATNSGVLGYDFTTSNAYASLGSGTPTGTISTTAGSGQVFTKATIAAGLTASSNMCVTFQRASGVLYAWIGGVIQYNGNEASGVTMLNFSSGGQQASVFNVAGFRNLADACSTQTGSIASNYSSLILMDFMLNEAINGVSTSTFMTAITGLIDRYTARGCSVLYLIPAGIPSSYSSTGHTNFPAFRQAIYTMAATRPNVCILDMSLIWGGDLTTAGVTQFNSGDNLHPNAKGYEDIANRVYNLLVDNNQKG